MSDKKYHFFTLQTATRYHIARALDALGWTRVNNEPEANFGDRHLALNDAVSQTLEYKNKLAQLIQKYKLKFMPMTYCIDDETRDDVLSRVIFDHYFSDQQSLQTKPDLKWILKPAMLNNAEQIKLFDDIQAVRKHYFSAKRLGGPHVLQQYIQDPALIDGRKFTFRIHVFVTNFGGISIYHRGYMNISAVPYVLEQGFEDKKMHITNYMLDGVQSHITQRTTEQMPGFEVIHAQMKKMITSVFKALLSEAPDYLAPINPPKFEIFGVDFLLDKQGKLWLIEINQGPDAPMYEDNPLKPILWEPFWRDVIENFVLPIADNVAGPISHPHFQPLLTKSQCYSAWRAGLKRLFSKPSH